MNNIIKITEFINILQIILFITGTYALFHKSTSPKARADLATINVIILLIYCLCFLIIFFEGLLKDEYSYLVSVIFIIAPFIIGKFVRYQTLKIYSTIQLVFFCLSLIYLLNLHY